MIEKAKERMEQIMATHNVVPLSDSQDAEIDKILGQARKYYKEKGLL